MANVDSPANWRTGLSEAEAQARLKAEGYNELPRPDRRTTLRIVFEVVREPMIALLLAGGRRLSGARRLARGADPARVRQPVRRDHRHSGDPHRARSGSASGPDEPARARHPRRRAQADTGPRSGARRHRRPFRRRPSSRRRGARRMRGPAGRRIAADRRIRAGPEETAEADRDANAERRPGGDDSPFVFSGSLVVRGAGIAEVIATGPDERDRQDRPVAQHARRRAAAAANGR